MPTEPGTVLQNRYRLDEHIAVGGMGEVWQGTDLVLNRTVAVKLLRPEHAGDTDLVARFRAEARMAGLLSHANIAQVFDFGEAEPPDPAYLVMEYVDGPSLAGLLHDGPLEPGHTMDIVAQAARGLAAAHRAGMIHRDIKPGNLLLREDGLVKVSDFGIARAEAATPVTRTGQLPGTPGYMAPERSAGAEATPASDLYSLGVVAHQCLTGRPPFEGEALAVVIAHMEREMPSLPPSVPAPVAALIAELTSKDPQFRPSSAQRVAERAERLKDIQAGASDGTPQPPAVAPTKPDLPRLAMAGAGGASLLQPRTWRNLRVPHVPRRAWVASLAVVAIAIAGFVGWMLGARPISPTAGSPHAPHASSPAGQVPAAGQIPTPGPGPTVTPDNKPSAQPSTSPSPTPSPTPTPTPTASASPTASPSPSPSSSATPSPGTGPQQGSPRSQNGAGEPAGSGSPLPTARLSGGTGP